MIDDETELSRVGRKVTFRLREYQVHLPVGTVSHEPKHFWPFVRLFIASNVDIDIHKSPVYKSAKPSLEYSTMKCFYIFTVAEIQFCPFHISADPVDLLCFVHCHHLSFFLLRSLASGASHSTHNLRTLPNCL